MAMKQNIVLVTAMLTVTSIAGVAQRVDRQTGEAIKSVDLSVDTQVRVRDLDVEPVGGTPAASQPRPGIRASQPLSKWGPPQIVRGQTNENQEQPVSAFKGRADKDPLASGTPEQALSPVNKQGSLEKRGSEESTLKAPRESISSASFGSATQQSEAPIMRGRVGVGRHQRLVFSEAEKRTRLRATRSAQQKLPSTRKHSGTGSAKNATGNGGLDHEKAIGK